MTTENKLLLRVREELKDVRDVEEKKMFGSIGFMVRGKLCVAVRPERIMCRIDPALHDAALKHEGSRTVTMKGRKYRGYLFVSAEALKTKKALKYWIDLALSYNKTIASKKK